jgi:hypothetical protein
MLLVKWYELLTCQSCAVNLAMTKVGSLSLFQVWPVCLDCGYHSEFPFLVGQSVLRISLLYNQSLEECVIFRVYPVD